MYSSLCLTIQLIDLEYLAESCLSVWRCKKYSLNITSCSCSGLLFELKEVLQSLQKYLLIPLLEPLEITFLDLQFTHILELFYSHL